MDDRPPGWYRDADDARGHRYWDGHDWLAAQADPSDALVAAEQQ
jgi:hypothetical protein